MIPSPPLIVNHSGMIGKVHFAANILLVLNRKEMKAQLNTANNSLTILLNPILPGPFGPKKGRNFPRAAKN